MLLLLALLLAPQAHSEVLWRTWKNPKPSPVRLTKNFYETREVKDTCYEQKCGMMDTRVCEQKCTDSNEWQNVCHQDYQCETGSDGQQNCQWKEVCEQQWVPKHECHEECHYEPQQTCWDESYACTVEKQVLVRSWKVMFKPTFDPKAVPTKNHDEKLTLTLQGDEHDPKLDVKVNAGPFKYTIDSRFSDDRKEVLVDFKLLTP